MPELYYAIMNILDYLALNDVSQVRKTELLKICDTLLPYTESQIRDLSDANDCGLCDNWDDFINELKENFKIGNRK